MTKMIVAALLGFFTIPTVIIALICITEAAKMIAGFGMMPSHYWAGFFLLVGCGCVFLSTLPFWVS